MTDTLIDLQVADEVQVLMRSCSVTNAINRCRNINIRFLGFECFMCVSFSFKMQVSFCLFHQ